MTVSREPVVRRGAGACAVLVLAVTAVGCGYALAGRGNALPAHIRVIGIPAFANTTPYPEIERIVTESVREEFSSRGQFRVEPEVGGVDATLTGTITRVELVPTALTASLQASRYVVIFVVAVEFRDETTNDVLWSNPNMTFRDEYDVPAEASVGDPTAYFRQDVNAISRIAKNFARSVITAILEAF